MADITNPEAIAFCNDPLRSICEMAEVFKVRINNMSVKWYGGVNGIVGTSPDDLLIDDRPADADVTGADITNAVAGLLAAAATLNDAVIGKLAVRPIRVPIEY